VRYRLQNRSMKAVFLYVRGLVVSGDRTDFFDLLRYQ
jgi:hypothetical protein